MLSGLIQIVIVFALTAGGWWLVLKLRKRQNKLAKFGGMIGIGLLSTLFTVFTIAAALGFISLYAPRGNDVLEVTVAGTAEQVARGEVIAAAMCASCHSLNKELPLSGNTNLLEEIPMPLGVATPPNLTPASRIADWTDGELQRVIREGTYPNGHRAAVMSSQNFRVFSQDDLDSIVAYLRSTPAVASDIEPKQGLNVLAFAFITLGMLPLKDQPDTNVAPPAIPKAPTIAYGKYVATFADCTACHGETLEGGAGGLLPKGPSLRGVIGWRSEDFTTAMRTGVTPGGKELSDKMPWEAFRHFDDESLDALYEYITSL